MRLAFHGHGAEKAARDQVFHAAFLNLYVCEKLMNLQSGFAETVCLVK